MAGRFMAGPASPQASGDTEHVLNPIRVSAPAPHLGTLMVRPVIASRGNVPVSSVELIFAPVELADTGSERLKGWRKGGGQVAVFTADPVSFTPDPSICAHESIHTAGWSRNQEYE